MDPLPTFLPDKTAKSPPSLGGGWHAEGVTGEGPLD